MFLRLSVHPRWGRNGLESRFPQNLLLRQPRSAGGRKRLTDFGRGSRVLPWSEMAGRGNRPIASNQGPIEIRAGVIRVGECSLASRGGFGPKAQNCRGWLQGPARGESQGTILELPLRGAAVQPGTPTGRFRQTSEVPGLCLKNVASLTGWCRVLRREAGKRYGDHPNEMVNITALEARSLFRCGPEIPTVRKNRPTLEITAPKARWSRRANRVLRPSLGLDRLFVPRPPAEPCSSLPGRRSHDRFFSGVSHPQISPLGASFSTRVQISAQALQLRAQASIIPSSGNSSQ